ncbi:MAG: hypothetical protein K0Q79_1513 [Flavipsychrobacter sp.]|jgi:hypothetical protein|nr:hypothetical protein [Flavipsychrobacter sp.]
MSTTVNQLFTKLSDEHSNIESATPVKRRESAAQRRERVKMLEENPEEWIKYYFPKYAKAVPAPFHVAATKRVLENAEWYEVRNWSRELAKSTRVMMEVFYLTLVGNYRRVECGETERNRESEERILEEESSNDESESQARAGTSPQPSPQVERVTSRENTEVISMVESEPQMSAEKQCEDTERAAEEDSNDTERSAEEESGDTEIAMPYERVKKKNVLLISNSLENAERLLMPYMLNLAKNNRIIHDYGAQKQLGQWTSTEFVTRGGVAFRAVGAGQSPRGSRNEDARPDIIIFDDLDTDADCLNPDIIERRWHWVEQAVIPARSISNPLLVLWCGNIIAEDCCVVRAQKLADHVDIVNIRDEQGLSTWPQKNSEPDIDRVLSKISYASQQKEYFNNPMNTGRTFTQIVWGKCPPLSDLNLVVVYADPGTSNRDIPAKNSGHQTSRKAIFIVGKKDARYYVYHGYLDIMSQDNFMRCLYEARNYIAGLCTTFYVIECNSLQEPFHDEVIAKKNSAYGATHGGALSLTKDTRRKTDKWLRIEAELEPLNRDGNLIFNEEELDNPHMERLAAQLLAASATSKQMDGPDCIEGAKYFLDRRQPVKENVGQVERVNPKRY